MIRECDQASVFVFVIRQSICADRGNNETIGIFSGHSIEAGSSHDTIIVHIPNYSDHVETVVPPRTGIETPSRLKLKYFAGGREGLSLLDLVCEMKFACSGDLSSNPIIQTGGARHVTNTDGHFIVENSGTSVANINDLIANSNGIPFDRAIYMDSPDMQFRSMRGNEFLAREIDRVLGKPRLFGGGLREPNDVAGYSNRGECANDCRNDGGVVSDEGQYPR
jgi:hypothetical protein